MGKVSIGAYEDFGELQIRVRLGFCEVFVAFQ